jgi:hypoxanthine phosphoribosyltransferase
MPSLMVSMNSGGIAPSAYLHNQLDITPIFLLATEDS